MSVVDQLIVIREHSSALLQRISDFRTHLMDARLCPSILKACLDADIWPLTKPNEAQFNDQNVSYS